MSKTTTFIISWPWLITTFVLLYGLSSFRSDYMEGALTQIVIQNIQDATDAECVYHGLQRAAFVVVIGGANPRLAFVRMTNWNPEIIPTENSFIDMIFGEEAIPNEK